MSDQEYIRQNLKSMQKDMRDILQRGSKYEKREMDAMTEREITSAMSKQQGKAALSQNQQRIRNEMRRQLMIDDQTRSRLLARKTVPAIVREAEQEKRQLRNTANANAIVKFFKGISKTERDLARTQLSEIEQDTETLNEARKSKTFSINKADFKKTSVPVTQSSSETQSDLQTQIDLQQQGDLQQQSIPKQQSFPPQKSVPKKKSVSKKKTSSKSKKKSGAPLIQLEEPTTRKKKKVPVNDGFYGTDDYETQLAIERSLREQQGGYYDEDAALKQALEESKKDYNGGYTDDDEAYKIALQESLKDSGQMLDLQSEPMPQQQAPALSPEQKAKLLQDRANAEVQIAALKIRQQQEGFPLMPADIYEAAEYRNQMTSQTVKREHLVPEAQKLYDFLDECVQVYRVIKEVDEQLYSEAESFRRKPKTHDVMLEEGLAANYEAQGPNNCYCCAGTALYNQFMLNEQDMDQGGFLSQYEMRAYKPDYLSLEEYKKQVPGADKKSYDKEVADLELFCGKGKREYGNIYAIGDYLLKRRKDIALQRSVFSFARVSHQDANASTIRHNMIEKFRDTVADVLATGNAVALRVAYHYITIVGIKDNKICVLDSAGGDPHTPEWRNIHTVIGVGNNVELTWIRKITDPEKLTGEYQDLEYKDGKFKKKGGIFNEDIAHQLGVNVSKVRSEKDADVGGYVQESIYVPKVHKEVVKELEDPMQEEEQKQEQKEEQEEEFGYDQYDLENMTEEDQKQ